LGGQYQDLVRAVDIVVTKPGYGIVSECIANDTAILYTSRGRFAEYDVLVAGMQRYARSQFIPQDALLAGQWEPYLTQLWTASAPAEQPRIDGARVAAEMILELIQ
jgi:L-arabinokinase